MRSGYPGQSYPIDSGRVVGIKPNIRCTNLAGMSAWNGPMRSPKLSRRTVLQGAGAVLAGTTFATRVVASAPPPEPVTPELIAAATKEGQVIHYTSADLPVAEKLGKAFEAKYPGIAVRVERTGAERVFQRIGQEYAANIHAVDVVNSSDAAHFIVWKRDGILAPYVPEDVAKFYPAEHRDIDGQFASWRVWLSIIAYNSSLVKADEAPKSFADLLDPKWKGKIVKAHPGYSGTIMTATYQMQRDLGWSFFEQLAKQNIMQVQSSADPPKKLDLGERSVMADGNEYNIFQLREAGRPVEPVYASEGTPIIIGPNGIFKNSPNPNAAKLFQSFCFSRDAQQLIIDVGGLRSVHPQTQEKPGRRPLKDIKTMKDDAAAVEQQGDTIKARYSKIFHV
jgi:iron(III) transport system substrate-binding protein